MGKPPHYNSYKCRMKFERVPSSRAQILKLSLKKGSRVKLRSNHLDICNTRYVAGVISTAARVSIRISVDFLNHRKKYKQLLEWYFSGSTIATRVVIKPLRHAMLKWISFPSFTAVYWIDWLLSYSIFQDVSTFTFFLIFAIWHTISQTSGWRPQRRVKQILCATVFLWADVLHKNSCYYYYSMGCVAYHQLDLFVFPKISWKKARHSATLLHTRHTLIRVS